MNLRYMKIMNGDEHGNTRTLSCRHKWRRLLAYGSGYRQSEQLFSHSRSQSRSRTHGAPCQMCRLPNRSAAFESRQNLSRTRWCQRSRSPRQDGLRDVSVSIVSTTNQKAAQHVACCQLWVRNAGGTSPPPCYVTGRGSRRPIRSGSHWITPQIM